MRLLAVSTAFIGAVAGSAASASVALAASTTVLTIAGNTMVVKTPMAQELKGSLCQAPAYSCKPVPYRSGAVGRAPLEEGVKLLQQALLDNASAPVIVLAYSQGGMIATPWLEKYGAGTDRGADRPENEVILVLFGSPQNGMGGLGPAVGSRTRTATPTDTGYTIIEISRQYDPESDYPLKHGNLFAVMNAMSGFSRVHTDYTQVDIYDPNNLVAQRGGTFYLLIPTKDLPILAPLRAFGLKTLAASISEWLKPLIDSAYDRSEYITVAQAREAGWALPDILSPPNQGAQFRTVWNGADVPSDAVYPEPDALVADGPGPADSTIKTGDEDEFLGSEGELNDLLSAADVTTEEIAEIAEIAEFDEIDETVENDVLETEKADIAVLEDDGADLGGVDPDDEETADTAPTVANDNTDNQVSNTDTGPQ